LGDYSPRWSASCLWPARDSVRHHGALPIPVKLLKGLVALFACLLLIVLPSSAIAHPGNTDSQGGHTCHTNCASWGLRSGQYHYHSRQAPPPVPRNPAPQPHSPAPNPAPAPTPPPTTQAPSTVTPRPVAQSESEKWSLGEIVSAIIFIPLILVIPLAWGMFIYGTITGKIKNW